VVRFLRPLQSPTASLGDGLDSAAIVPPATTGAVLSSAARRGELLQVGRRPQIGAGAGRAWRAARVLNVVIDRGAVAFVGIGVVVGYWWAVSWLADASGPWV
jgi:hypothetical protein